LRVIVESEKVSDEIIKSIFWYFKNSNRNDWSGQVKINNQRNSISQYS
jgi:hypothetical protein